jgi:hypothetical protein
MCRAGTIAQHSLCYDPINVVAEDYAMWATIIQYGDAYNLRDRLTYYRLHANQMSNKLAAAQQCSADRISAAQIRAVDPDLVLTSPERQVLDYQFRLCVRLWSRKNPDHWTLASLVEAASVRLAAVLSPDARDVLDSVCERGLLQRLVRSFAAAHPTSDPVLSLLSENE